ncbi:hypothetical protein V8J82_22370 [Gymnodinialimonas sp. 2305UL16-5]|uniref:hypothetical protein n=1 Tax=Gymnodinialimonas mytili TaxID=3126503 RepID=UPI0030AD8AA9
MPQPENAFLYIWNDYSEARRLEYDKWHTFEHVPERVSLPGFEAGYRYQSEDEGTQAYFTEYRLASLEALETADYANVVDYPTEWSAKMRPEFSNVFRLPSRLICSAGCGTPGWVATIVFTVDDADASFTGLIHQSTSSMLRDRKISGYQISEADGVPPYKVFTQVNSNALSCAILAVVLSAPTKASANCAVNDLLAHCDLESSSEKLLQLGVYHFCYGIESSEVSSKRAEGHPEEFKVQ